MRMSRRCTLPPATLRLTNLCLGLRPQAALRLHPRNRLWLRSRLPNGRQTDRRATSTGHPAIGANLAGGIVSGGRESRVPRPGYSPTTLTTCVGHIDRPQQRIIVRRSGEIHRPQFGAMKSVVKLMAQGNAWRPAKGCVRDQCRTNIGHERNPVAHPGVSVRRYLVLVDEAPRRSLRHVVILIFVIL